MLKFSINKIDIRCLQSHDAMEIFEIIAKNEGLGPGLHLHEKMEESFYVIEGKVKFLINNQQKILKKGEFLKVERNTVHAWKSAEKHTKMLLIFSPSQNQLGYFTELEKLSQKNITWEKAISSLTGKFDNIPLEAEPKEIPRELLF